MSYQLPLPFPHKQRYDAGDFIEADANRMALAYLVGDWPDQRLALYGPGGCGKSHLLHIWAGQTGGIVLSGKTLIDLEGLPIHGTLALDDADRTIDETLLLHLLNITRDRGLRLLLAARRAPSRWPVRLADLSSRLRAMTAVEIKAPDDTLLAVLLRRLVADRQLIITQPAQDWMLRYLPRSVVVMHEAVAQLDKASLASGGPITRTLAIETLKQYVHAIADG